MIRYCSRVVFVYISHHVLRSTDVLEYCISIVSSCNTSSCVETPGGIPSTTAAYPLLLNDSCANIDGVRGGALLASSVMLSILFSCVAYI